MNVVVRDYYIRIFDLFEELVQFTGGSFSSYQNLISKIEILINKSIKFEILKIENINPDVYNSELCFDIKKNRIELLSIAYKIIVDNLYVLHITFGECGVYYEERLIKILSELEYEDYLRVYEINKKLVDDSLLESYKISYLRCDMNSFEKLRSEFQSRKLSKPLDDINIEYDKYKTINESILQSIDAYHKYITDNYPDIRMLFKLFNKDIRFYIFDAPKGGAYTCKLLAYENNNILNINIYNKILTVANRIGYNEEISKKVSCNIYSLFDMVDPLKYNIIFDVKHIHYELLQIFLMISSPDEIFHLFLYVLELNMLSIHDIDYANHSYIQERDSNEIEICCHFLKDIDIRTVGESERKYDEHIFLTKPDNITLNSLGYKVVYFSKYVNPSYHLSAISYYIKDRLRGENLINLTQKNGQILLDKLSECKKGKTDWSKYENIGYEIFEYLFKSDFRNFIVEIQSTIELNIHRRDLIVNNLPNEVNCFWNDIKTSFNTNVIICEFKNYCSPLNADNLYNTTKYLNNRNKFILIFSRLGCDESAKLLQVKLLKESGIFILVLDDNDIIDMIKEKELSINVLYRLENLRFELEKLI